MFQILELRFVSHRFVVQSGAWTGQRSREMIQDGCVSVRNRPIPNQTSSRIVVRTANLRKSGVHVPVGQVFVKHFPLKNFCKSSINWSVTFTSGFKSVVSTKRVICLYLAKLSFVFGSPQVSKVEFWQRERVILRRVDFASKSSGGEKISQTFTKNCC